MSMLAAAIVTLSSIAHQPMPAQPDQFTERLPKHLVEWTMVAITGTDVWMSQTEVTWDLYDIWAFRLDLTQEQEAAGVDAKSRPSKPYGAIDRGFGHSGYPALAMTAHSAKQFCEWLSEKTGRHYRLPTLAEWTAAAGPLPEKAWLWEESFDTTHPVAKLEPNAIGLYDMYGNVQEWVAVEDGEAVSVGGSFTTRREALLPPFIVRQTSAWNNTDPQIPKSLWWLSDAPFVGFRLVCEE